MKTLQSVRGWMTCLPDVLKDLEEMLEIYW